MKLIDEDISDEGEIFSDDEEAAYYPKIVKCRDNAKARSSGKSSSAKPTTEDDSSGNSSSGPFDHDSGHKDYSSENQDSLDHDRSSRQSSDGSKCSPSSSSARDSHGRRRVRWSKQEQGGWNDGGGSGGHRGKLGGVAQPHHRQHRHEGRSGSGGGSLHNMPARLMSSYQITCVAAAVKERRDRGEALLVTPRGNTCNNLDQFNYPAPPSWYLEAVEVYEKEKEREAKSVGEPTPNEDKGVLEVVVTDLRSDGSELPCIEPEVKVDGEPGAAVQTLEAPKAGHVGESARSQKDTVALSIANGDESEDDYDRYLDQLDEEEDEIEDLTPDIGSVVTSLNEEFPQLNPLPEQPQTLGKLAGVFPEEESLRLLLKLDTGDDENGPVQGDAQSSKPGTQ